MLVVLFVFLLELITGVGADDVLVRLGLLEQKVDDHEARLKVIEEKLGITLPTDPCSGVVCQDSEKTCPDGFVSKCSNSCTDGVCSQCTPSCVSHEGDTRPVIVFQLDDLQAWWLESESSKVVDLHIQKGIPVTLGVIPEDLMSRNGYSGSITENLKKWNKNNKNVVEAAVHTYDHCCSYNGWSLDQQTNDIKKGKAIFDQLGITTYSFVPAYDWGDANTPKAIVNAGLLIGMDALNNGYLDSLKDPMIIEDGAWYGYGFTTFDYNTISKMIDSKIGSSGRDYFVFGFHQQDLQTSSRRSQYSALLDKLKSSGKYRFMTAKQYYDYKNK